MDETAFPILLIDLLRREASQDLGDLNRWWEVARRAAAFLITKRPGHATRSLGRRFWLLSFHFGCRDFGVAGRSGFSGRSRSENNRNIPARNRRQLE